MLAKICPFVLNLNKVRHFFIATRGRPVKFTCYKNNIKGFFIPSWINAISCFSIDCLYKKSCQKEETSLFVFLLDNHLCWMSVNYISKDSIYDKTYILSHLFCLPINLYYYFTPFCKHYWPFMFILPLWIFTIELVAFQ